MLDSVSLARFPRRRRKGIVRIAMHVPGERLPWWPFGLGCNGDECIRYRACQAEKRPGVKVQVQNDL